MDLSILNKQQRLAIEECEGPTLVVAGAGSGKTRVLTYKIAYLIENGVSPYNILAITFTNKAAKEMRERIIDIVGSNALSATISTFHSFGARILRSEITCLGYDKSFTILDGNDQMTVIKQILKDLDVDTKKYNPRYIQSKISGLKSEGIGVNESVVLAMNYYDELVAKVYSKYSDILKINNCVDFDDLLILPVKIFKEFPEILSKYQNHYLHVLVDEYQDTNSLQYQLVKLIGSSHKNIFVVGDGDQSIYSWRGANIENILNFEKDYDGAKTVLLEQNYRSTKNIISAANNVIEKNKQRKPKHLFTENEEGELITYFRASNEKEEVEDVLNEIVKLIRKGTDLNEIAILYRTNAQSRVYEEGLLRENIAYNIVGSYYFYARKEIKDVLAYLRLIINPNDDISFTRVVNEPKRGIGLTTIEKLRTVAAGNNVSLMEAIKFNYLSDKANNGLINFRNLIFDAQEFASTHSISHIIKFILEKSGYATYIGDDSIESSVKREYIEEFLSVADVFEETHEEITIEEFLEEISLVADMKQYQDLEHKLTLMTLHAAKGLEYDYVFLVGMEEGILPHRNSMNDLMSLEEERRLCYVGITRARKKLYIASANIRMFLGTRAMNMQSRFIKEIGNGLIEQNGEVVETKPVYSDTKYSAESTNKFKTGDKVKHAMFGQGIIVSIDETILNVAFSQPHGLKKISSLYNTLELI